MSLRDFTADDMALLKSIIRDVTNQRANTPSRLPGESAWDKDEDHQAPETYIAKTPTGGIPGLSDTTPGRATCTLYKVQLNQSTGPELVQVSNAQKEIYNTSETDIDGDIFIPVTRSKVGKWLALVPGSGISQRIRFVILSVDDCDNAAIVEITARPCGVSKVKEESACRVRVYDSLGCFFDDEENADLVGREGWATYMQPKDPVDAICVGTSTGTDAIATTTGTGTDTFCLWEIDELCCPPETGTC